LYSSASTNTYTGTTNVDIDYEYQDKSEWKSDTEQDDIEWEDDTVIKQEPQYPTVSIDDSVKQADKQPYYEEKEFVFKFKNTHPADFKKLWEYNQLLKLRYEKGDHTASVEELTLENINKKKEKEKKKKAWCTAEEVARAIACLGDSRCECATCKRRIQKAEEKRKKEKKEIKEIIIPKKDITKINVIHVHATIPAAKQKSRNFECSVCHTNQYIYHKVGYGLRCSKCDFVVQCHQCGTVCNMKSVAEKKMGTFPVKNHVGYYICRVCPTNPMILNYPAHLRCSRCKRRPDPSKVFDIDPSNVSEHDELRCIECEKEDNDDSCKQRGCDGKVVKHNQHGYTSMNSSYTINVCDKCGTVASEDLCDPADGSKQEYDDDIEMVDDGAIIRSAARKRGSAGYIKSSSIQEIDGKSVMHGEHYVLVDKICNSMFSLMSLQDDPRRSRWISDIKKIVRIACKNKNHQVEMRTVTAMIDVLGAERPRISKKRVVDASYKCELLAVRNEKNIRRQLKRVRPSNDEDEEAERQELLQQLPDGQERKRQLQKDITRTMKCTHEAAEQVIHVKPTNLWDDIVAKVAEQFEQDQVLREWFQNRPLSEWLNMLKRGRYQVALMHKQAVANPEAVINRYIDKTHLDDVATAAYYLAQLPVLLECSQIGRSTKFEGECREKFILHRVPFKSIIKMARANALVWMLPTNLRSKTYKDLVDELENYSF
jgi:hypothetical protein